MSDLAKQVQDELPTIEASVLFYDGESKSFSRQTDNAIESLTSEYFIEYISDNLEVDKGEKFGAAQQSLLDQDNESYGLRRLYEALQCCMWSNMQQVQLKQPPAMKKMVEPELKASEAAPHELEEKKDVEGASVKESGYLDTKKLVKADKIAQGFVDSDDEDEETGEMLKLME